jgi:hypothetical protein
MGNQFSEQVRSSMKRFGGPRGLGALALGTALALAPITVASAGTNKTKQPKSPTKCTAAILKPSLSSVTRGTAYTVNEVGCSGLWAYVIFTAGGSQQVDVLHYSNTLTTWIPDNTPTVCQENILPASISTKACHGSLDEVQ